LAVQTKQFSENARIFNEEAEEMKELCSWIWGNQFARGCVVTVLVILIGTFLWECGYEAALYDYGIKTETVTDSK
jgi:hypothetical protein